MFRLTCCRSLNNKYQFPVQILESCCMRYPKARFQVSRGPYITIEMPPLPARMLETPSGPPGRGECMPACRVLKTGHPPKHRGLGFRV